MNGQSIINPALRLLHLEDSEADAELVRETLTAELPECRIDRVHTRDAFAAALRNQVFDLILSDYSMPGFNGMSALELAQALQPETPYIFLSGTIGEDNAVEALKKGAVDIVIKDRLARLVPTVRRALKEMREKQGRQAAEQQLRESQERFQQLAEQSSEIFWFVALNPERILYVGPAIEQTWGVPAIDFYADPRRWMKSIHPDDAPRVVAAYDACLCGKLPRFDEEYRVVRPDGSVRWVLDTGTLIRNREGIPFRLSGVAKDITERKAIEQRLREQAELLDKARDAICVIDIEGRVTYWNQSSERVFGWKAAEALGRPLTRLLFRDDSSLYGTARGALVDEGAWSGNLQISSESLKDISVESRWTLVRDAEGRPQSILIINTDVTDQKKLEQRFLRAQRLESIGTLAGGIAHDLNNMLAPILMATSMLHQQIKDEKQRRMVAILEASAEHGAALVRQVLAFAQGTEGARTNLSPNEAVRDTLKLLGETLPRSITIETDLPPEPWPIVGNNTQLGQVLMNLCVNARDAMPEGGRLTIRVENRTVEETEARANPGARAGPHVRITVEDTGTGIPDAIIDRIFDPFFTTKKAGRGTGLGLSTVLGIVRSDGGFLKVRSKPGKGTQFELFFPAAATPATSDPIPAAARGGQPGRGETILVIDDEHAVREILRGLLEFFGYCALVAPDGPAGIALFRVRKDDVHAVITDIMMPGMQGAQVVRELRAIDSDVRIVAMSGVIDERTGVVEEAGKISFLRKPMTGEEIVQALQRVMRQTTAVG